MNELMPRINANGDVEVYGASTKLTEQLSGNFADRGRLAATLLIATLTESPYTPEIDDEHFAVEVSNVFHNPSDPEDKTAKDTVEVAREALAEFIVAPVPGSRPVSLDRFKTKYETVLDEIIPSRGTPKLYVGTFNESFVETARGKDVNISSPEQGFRIIKGAPKKIGGLLLSLHSKDSLSSSAQKHDMVTSDGRIVTIRSYRRSSLVSPTYGFATESENLSFRGGRAPRANIAKDIEDRVVKLRTSHTKRG